MEDSADFPAAPTAVNSTLLRGDNSGSRPLRGFRRC
jgi:hypothetical protein